MCTVFADVFRCNLWLTCLCILCCVYVTHEDASFGRFRYFWTCILQIPQHPSTVSISVWHQAVCTALFYFFVISSDLALLFESYLMWWNININVAEYFLSLKGSSQVLGLKYLNGEVFLSLSKVGQTFPALIHLL